MLAGNEDLDQPVCICCSEYSFHTLYISKDQMILHAASEDTEKTAEAFGRYFCATVQMFVFCNPPNVLILGKFVIDIYSKTFHPSIYPS